MAKSLYVTVSQSRSGKSAIVLGIMQVLLRHIRKVGFFRPIIDPTRPDSKDHDIDLVLSHFYIGLSYEQTWALTMDDAKQLINEGKQSQVMEIILTRYKQLEAQCQFVLCEGTDFAAGSEAFEFDINAMIAANLGSPALVIANGARNSVDAVVSQTQLTMDNLRDKGVDLLGAIVNRAQPESIDMILAALRTGIGATSCPECLFYVIPEIDRLAMPTVKDVQKWLRAEVLYGHDHLDGLIENYAVAAMQLPNFLNHLKKNSLVVTPGDRSDIVVACLASRLSTAYPDISGIVLTGGMAPPESITRLIEGWKGMPVPILLVNETTFPTTTRLNRLYGRIDAGDTRKIATALGAFETHVDTEELQRKLITRKSVRITPQMFEYGLIEKAKKNKQHIVLPEGVGERILTAADILLRRKVCDLTLLGRERDVQDKIVKLGLDLSGLTIIDPKLSPMLDDYAETYYDMRRNKGITPEAAWDAITDPTFFGTMMVHKGHADGMVSGSIHTTADTITPAFQIIKTRSDATIVSSVMLMCLKDRVLAFGDCAINPNPTAAQLAEIAVVSAHTARIFGIEPRVALLSYSTGNSGRGADVEKVIEATAIAHKKYPDLLLEGPLQYDAAIDPEVAATKLPDSKVAGRATVFIFPDLNTGNNTYKAVQRASDQVVAIGPVLQGLNKPVNDLSRGCTVPDIVNTVAITAIQAQAGKGLI
ncbi:MAG: phosphate acetyltransferase [Desulfobacterales bacterium]|nr:phosphate acetyltransferase [Desulfobacterales bacterium]